MTAVLEVEDLAVSFPSRGKPVRAVDELSLSLEAGETLGLVGESGSGKTVTALAALGLLPRSSRVRGRILFDGRDLLTLPEREWRRVRGNRISMVFQDPMTSLNPLLTIGRQLEEVFECHRSLPRRQARTASIAALGEVGLPRPEARMDAYPHELSGGMRQRVLIAMALACRPSVLFADEPTTALDVTIQAQILDLLGRMQRESAMAVVLITHDLGVVASSCDRVHVLYAGRSMETARTDPLFAAPMHPYTSGLLRSVPRLDDPRDQPLPTIAGHPAVADGRREGCPFEPRCPHAALPCRTDPIPLVALPGGRASACSRPDALRELEARGTR